jgi:hypothetical protein
LLPYIKILLTATRASPFNRPPFSSSCANFRGARKPIWNSFQNPLMRAFVNHELLNALFFCRRSQLDLHILQGNK